MSHGEGGRSRVEGQDHVTGSECAATTTVTAAAVKVEVTKKIISASFTAATAFDTAQPALSHAGKQSRLINHPVPSTASRSSSASGDSSSCSVEDRESRWAGRSQALQQFEEELKMSVILCTAGYDHTIRFWEALSGICSRTIQHPDSQVNRLCITPDKRFLAAAGHHNVKLYDIKSTNPNPVMTFDGHTNNITGVAFHCEGKWMVTSSEDGTVKVWDTRTGSLQRNYAHRAPVNDVAIHPNQGELVSGDRAGIVRVWDLGESVCTHQLIPEEDVAVQSVSVASDGSLLCAGNKKGNVYIWRMIQDVEVTRIVPICTFQAHKDYLIRILLSPDVKHLATCSADHTAKVWNLDFDYPPAKMAAAAAAKAKARGISGPEAKSNPSTPGSSESLDPAVIQEKNRLQDLNAFRIVAGSPAPVEEPPNPFPAQPDGPPMDPTSGTPFLETVLSQHQRWVWDCAFSADSAYLVTVSSDHYARLWELNTGQVIRQYNGHHRGAVCVALNDYSEPR